MTNQNNLLLVTKYESCVYINESDFIQFLSLRYYDLVFNLINKIIVDMSQVHELFQENKKRRIINIFGQLQYIFDGISENEMLFVSRQYKSDLIDFYNMDDSILYYINKHREYTKDKTIYFYKQSSSNFKNTSVVFNSQLKQYNDVYIIIVSKLDIEDFENTLNHFILVRITSNKNYILYFRLSHSIAMTDLGWMGRFGNQIFQYLYLMTINHIYPNINVYSQCAGLSNLFNCNIESHHNIPDANNSLLSLSYKLEDNTFISHHPFNAGIIKTIVGRNISGYFQFHSSYLRPYKNFIINNLLALNDNAQEIENKIIKIFNSLGYSIGLHYRQGDFLNNNFSNEFSDCFFTPPIELYLNSCKRYNLIQENIFIYFASDEEKDLSCFTNHGITIITYKYLIECDLSLASIQPMFLDYLALKNSQVLMISNSTFSMTAAMINTQCKLFLRPIHKLDYLIPFDPWNDDIAYGTNRMSHNLSLR